eukprot:scaffold348_cov329-Pavlova_lutheri.AAC.33
MQWFSHSNGWDRSTPSLQTGRLSGGTAGGSPPQDSTQKDPPPRSRWAACAWPVPLPRNEAQSRAAPGCARRCPCGTGCRCRSLDG